MTLEEILLRMRLFASDIPHTEAARLIRAAYEAGEAARAAKCQSEGHSALDHGDRAYAAGYEAGKRDGTKQGRPAGQCCFHVRNPDGRMRPCTRGGNHTGGCL